MAMYLILLIGLTLQGLEFAHAKSSFYSYHHDVGIPTARRIFEAEQAMKNNEGDINSRIVGGTHAALGERPFMCGIDATLTDGNHSVCGCSLIHTKMSLTAGHCWFNTKHQAVEFLLRFGSLRLYQGGDEIITKNVIVHENYDPFTLLNDIAVIYHDEVQLTDNIKTIALPPPNIINKSLTGKWVTVSGYGRTSSVDPDGEITWNQVLSKVDLQVITNAECKRVFGFWLQDTNICTKGVPGAGIGTCQGDSGSALTLDENGTKYVVGVVSYGREECDKPAPHLSVFTRVTKFITWINDKMKNA